MNTSTATPTPALIIDLPIVHRNIARLADYGRTHRIAVRPHTKTHKSLRMARLQLDAGATGLTAAKVGEAITMSQATDDLFVAYPALDPWRREHLANLARTKSVRVGFDSTEAADWIGAAAKNAGSTIGALVDLDVGPHRTGVPTPADALRWRSTSAKPRDCASMASCATPATSSTRPPRSQANCPPSRQCCAKRSTCGKKAGWR